MMRRVVVVALALLLAAQVVRNALVSSLAPVDPRAAARVWPGHPDVQLSLGMTSIGAAARARKAVDAATFRTIDEAALKAPLAPEPFLVRGVQAQLAGDRATARKAFQAAEWRDPRSLPARYFLANDYFQSGDVRKGLGEFAALARLAPNGVANVAPYIATYARDRSNWTQLRSLFRSEPELEDPALSVLAADPANADAVLALADVKRSNARSPWLAPLLAGLVETGQFARARAIWAKTSGATVDPRQLIYDARFADEKAPPPFNWALTSSTVGLAERQPGTRLHVIYYGQEDGDLAKQLLALPPGAYRLSARVSGGAAPQLSWSLSCVKASRPFATLGLTGGPSLEWTFSVPSDCPAQWLALTGSSSDIARQTELTVSDLTLIRVSPNG